MMIMTIMVMVVVSDDGDDSMAMMMIIVMVFVLLMMTRMGIMKMRVVSMFPLCFHLSIVLNRICLYYRNYCNFQLILSYKSVTGRHKIIILDEADSMTTAAQQGELSNNDMI